MKEYKKAESNREDIMKKCMDMEQENLSLQARKEEVEQKLQELLDQDEMLKQHKLHLMEQ